MNRYEFEEKIGEGSFGTVYLAKKRGYPDKCYAIKKLKQQFVSWKNVVVEREFQAMVALMANHTKKNHGAATDGENIHPREWNHSHSSYLVRVYEIIRQQDASLYFVMEYMGDGNLQDYISEKCKRKLSRSLPNDSTRNHKYFFDNSEIRSILFQAFRGLTYIHSKSMIHRDIKPENILLDGGKVKLADFSLARCISAGGNGCDKGGDSEIAADVFTDYVGTRWYRAPELLCRDSIADNTGGDDKNNETSIDSINQRPTRFTPAIDVFSMGCVAAELYNCHPLFCGRDEREQLHLIEKLLLFSGSIFPGKRNFAAYKQDISEQAIKKRLRDNISVSDSATISFLYNILHISPEQRATTEAVLSHKYFEREYSTATGRKTMKESPTMFATSILRTKRAKNSILRVGTTSKSITGTDITTNEAISDQESSSARITPTFPNPASCGFVNQNQSTRDFPSHKLVSATPLDNSGSCSVTGVSTGTKFGMSRKLSFQRKRQKSRPSQTFKID